MIKFMTQMGLMGLDHSLGHFLARSAKTVFLGLKCPLLYDRREANILRKLKKIIYGTYFYAKIKPYQRGGPY